MDGPRCLAAGFALLCIGAIAGCGSSGHQSATSGTGDRTSGGSVTRTSAAAPDTAAMHQTTPQPGKKGSLKPAQPQAKVSKPKNSEQSHHAPEEDQQQAPQRTHFSGQGRCAQIEAKLCRAMQQASAEGRETSKPLPQGRCPSSMSRMECAAAVKAWHQAKANSHPLPIDRCPPQWSRELCEAAIKASAEARE
jgi:hypothetical protein